MVEREMAIWLLRDFLSFYEKRLNITNSLYFGVCFLPGLARTKSPISDLQPFWIPCTPACFSDQRRQKCIKFTLSTIFLDRKETELNELGIFHHKWASFISQFILVCSCYSVQDKPCRPWRLVCHPLGSQSKPAWVPPPGGSYQGLALGFKWLLQLSPLDTCGKLSNANFGLFLPHQRAEESPWLTSSILLGLKWERLSQSFVCISPETVRIWLGLCLFFFPRLFSCRFLLSALSSVANGVLLLIPPALLNKPWQPDGSPHLKLMSVPFKTSNSKRRCKYRPILI